MKWLLVVALAGCGSRAQCELPAISAARGPSFLWRAHKGGDVIWLYGTIHDAGLDAVPANALAALEHSVRLVTELGDVEVDPDVFRKHARIASGPGIDQQLPADDWYDLRDAMRGAKIKEDDLRRAKPWYAMSLMTTYLAPTPGPSMDVLLTKRAHELAMPVAALETWDDQLSVVEAVVGLTDLQDALRARNTMKCDLARLRASYDSGDEATMLALLVIPRTQTALLTERNKKWLPAIEAFVTQGGAFVAVGLGHLLGDQGLPAMLARDGFTVERAKH